mmetsp:Transcript_27252/g.63765  ORF Transcript_27252/g.63765 Transcript_27252/m.63765 type:complete len:80 (-) Transcript_27252:24-263(-)
MQTNGSVTLACSNNTRSEKATVMFRYPMKRMESSLDHGWQGSVRFGKVNTAFWERIESNGSTSWVLVGRLNNCIKNIAS